MPVLLVRAIPPCRAHINNRSEFLFVVFLDFYAASHIESLQDLCMVSSVIEGFHYLHVLTWR